MKNPTISKVDKKYKCEFCDRVFNDNSNRHKHQKYRCPNRDKHTTLSEDRDINKEVINTEKDKMISIIKEQSEQINELKNMVKEVMKNGLQQQVQIQNQTNIQNQNNIIYINDKVDFIEVLTKRFGGDEDKAIRYIKEKISRNLQGDIELFCDIYLVGNKEDWPFIMTDEKNKIFLIKDREGGKYITDTGGYQIFQNFKSNYTDTLLRLTSREINKVTKHNTEAPDFEFKRDYLLDTFDLGCVQNKMYGLSKSDPQPFIKKLSVRIKQIEEGGKFS